MKLSKNSIHSKFYNLIFAKTPPDNLCDYFWSLVLGLLLFIPIIPGIVTEGIVEYYERKKGDYIKGNGLELWPKIAVSFLVYFAMAFIVLVISAFITKTLMMSILFGVIGLAIGIVWLFKKYRQIPKTIENNISEVCSIVKESVKSFKGKYCPRIDWN